MILAKVKLLLKQSPRTKNSDNLREVGALPEDSSRGMGAVEVPEKRGAGRRYLGRLGGNLFFLKLS